MKPVTLTERKWKEVYIFLFFFLSLKFQAHHFLVGGGDVYVFVHTCPFFIVTNQFDGCQFGCIFVHG